MSQRWRRVAFVVFLAYLGLAGYILGRFADNAMPLYYVYRPLAAAVPFAFVIGAVAAWLVPRYAPLAVVVMVGGLCFYSSYDQFLVPILAVGLVALGALVVARRRGWRLATLPSAVSTATAVFVVVFFVSGAARAWLTLEEPVPPVVRGEEATGPNVYLVWLDGYPRADTLTNDFGVDNSAFETALAERGFDLYPDAESDRIHSDYVLLTLLYGSTEGVPPNTDTSPEYQWDIRHRFSLAPLPIEAQEAGYEWWVIDSPAGFVTFEAGTHVQNGGMNTLEEFMLARSALAPLVKLLVPTWPTESLREHFQASLDSVVSLADSEAHRLVLAHIFEPHLPFLWDANDLPQPVPDFWPVQSLFVWQIEHVGMTVEEFGELQAGDLQHVNDRVLAMVDEISERDPSGVIVLFSDHGARYSLELQETEWPRSFLAARTPDHPNLFADDPSPTNILRTLLPTYITGASD
ncbi:MAG TPA: hypothetical protein VJ839_03945 [Candidatus Limnocylindria bacterium]|nr:hypothetical protein [Candidatus Limnocylindria bacterium]